MIFDRLGSFIARRWLWVLVFWVLAAVGIDLVAPRWDQITHDGDFAYLPERMTSVRGQELLDRAFPDALAKSQVAIVVSRSDGKLQEADFQVADRLIRRFTPKPGNERSQITDVWSYENDVIGKKLISRNGYNGQAVLIVLRLRTEFMAIDNMPLVAEIHETLQASRQRDDFPAGLELGVTGSAAIGTDMLFAAEESIRNTEVTTIGLVVFILLIVYRAPGLVIIPLATISISVLVATDLVALLSQIGQATAWYDLKIFKTTRIFIVVILFGAGTDYCLFLISRYKEELQRGRHRRNALAHALAQVGDALAASALTTILGLGMMFFADFGKFSNSGISISLCLVVALLASITLAPALLRATGRIAFWPFGASVRRATGPKTPDDRTAAMPSAITRLVWEPLSRFIVDHPGLVLVVSLLALCPLFYVGLSVPITYDLLNELSPDRPSVEGTQLLRRHFLTGETGPVTVVAYQPNGDFDSREGRQAIARLTKELYELTYADSQGRPQQPVVSVRSLTEPLGDTPGSFNPLSAAGRRKLVVLKHPRTKASFLSDAPGLEGKVTRFDLIFAYDPFSPESVRLLGHVEERLEQRAADRDSYWHDASFDFVGTTAGIRDLQAVTASDRVRIQVLVVIAVLIVLVLILRRPFVCFYLVLSVLLGYFVTIGTTELFFSWLRADSFHGLDWKVPIFLFVILIAVGEDYNIYLATRVFEEQRHREPLEGLRIAVVRTGGIITSCGVIMAGTFASMASGTLRAMQELGFSLALGVLLDTFIIRTILVPAFLAVQIRANKQRDVSQAALPENAPADDSGHCRVAGAQR